MRILIAILVLLLAGCGHVSVERIEGDQSFKMSTWTLWKDVEQVQGSKTDEGVEVSLGSSTSTDEAQALFLVCTINPGLPICEAK